MHFSIFMSKNKIEWYTIYSTTHTFKSELYQTCLLLNVHKHLSLGGKFTALRRMNCNEIKLCVSLTNQINRMTRLNNLEAKFTEFMFDML